MGVLGRDVGMHAVGVAKMWMVATFMFWAVAMILHVGMACAWCQQLQGCARCCWKLQCVRAAFHDGVCMPCM